MINRERLIKTFCDIVQIDSPSGEESFISKHLTDRFEAVGLQVENDGYGNLIATDQRENPFMLSVYFPAAVCSRSVTTKAVFRVGG